MKGPACELAPTRHFTERYIERRIYALSRSEELMQRILQALSRGDFRRDEKHRGVEGPRYQLAIKLGNRRLVVICEKTRSCFKLITLWIAGRDA